MTDAERTEAFGPQTFSAGGASSIDMAMTHDPANADSAVLYAVDQNTGKVQLPEDLFERRKKAAVALGGEHLIPESKIKFDRNEEGERISVGEYYYGAQEEEVASLFRNRWASGVRFAILRGDPGTGKNEFVKQMAAIQRAPLIDLNLGPRFDVQDALGGDGLGLMRITDKDGVETGPPVSGSMQMLGPLARAAQHPCIICMDEPEGLEEDLVSLNAAFGSDIGNPGDRFLTVNSMSGDEFSVKIDPDCMFFVTFNPGEQELRLRSSTMNRALNYDFEYPPVEEEMKMTATKVSKIMKYQNEAPGLQRDFTPDEVAPIVRFVRRLRDVHAKEPSSFIDFPDGRQGAMMFADLMLESYRENNDAVATMLHSLRYLMPGSRNMPVGERDRKIRQQAQDEYKNFVALAQSAAEQRMSDRGEKPKKKPAKKSSTK